MKKQGYTLIEVLFCLVLLSLIPFFSNSWFVQLRQNNEREVLIDTLSSAVRLAKLHALSKQKIIVLKPLDENSNWSAGFSMLEEGQKTPIVQWSLKSSLWRVDWHGVAGSGAIWFNPNLSHAMSNGTFVLTNVRSNEQVKLVLNRVGRVYTQVISKF